MSSLLEIRDLEVSLGMNGKTRRVIDRVNITVGEREVVGIVGESGCGKSMTALSIMGLLPHRVGRVTGGDIYFRGTPLSGMDRVARRLMRGRDVAMIFQEPMTSLNPVLTIGRQLSETVMLHRKMGRREAWDRGIDMLRLVGVSNPAQRMYEYPHQLSGGMRQRVMIAMALSCEPSLLIADEPTTALDVTIQAQLMLLLQNLRDELGMGIMLITHDLGVVANMADRVIVMYAGQIVEQASVRDLFFRPRHPYTEGLLRSVPSLDERVEKLHVITGTVPNLLFLAPGCRFNPRCPYAQEKCRSEEPVLESGDDGHSVRCWYPLTGERGES